MMYELLDPVHSQHHQLIYLIGIPQRVTLRMNIICTWKGPIEPATGRWWPQSKKSFVNDWDPIGFIKKASTMN